MSDQRKIRLVIADVDGTLLTGNKLLTDGAKAAVQALKLAGVRFAITSSRPPRGMSMFVGPLNLDTPLAAFNGGIFVTPDLSILEQRVLDAAAARSTLDLIRRNGLDAWLYSGNEWLVTDANGAHVAQETRTLNFGPEVVAGFDDRLQAAAKVVGVSDNYGLVERCETEANAALGGVVSASRSQPYYVDFTSVKANKGEVVDYLSACLRVPADQIATIGDSQNDVPMFKRSGFSIAMGNASDQVKAQAEVTTGTNNDDGFANAIEHFVLGRSGSPWA